MNALRRKFSATLESIESCRHDAQVRRAVGEFSLTLNALWHSADNRAELRGSAIYQEARAINAYLHSDPYTNMGITQQKLAERSLARAKRCQNWNDDLGLQHKATRATYDRLMGFDESSQSGVLSGNVETLGEILP